MRATLRSLVALALLAGVAAAQSSNVSPEQKQKAREAYAKAMQHFDLAEYKPALEQFKEAYRNFPEPTFLFNIGQCHRQLGEKEPAVRFFKTYLSKVPNAPNRVEVSTMITRLETALANEKSAVMGRPQGTIPAPLGEERPRARTAVAPPPTAKPEPKPEPRPEPVQVAKPTAPLSPIPVAEKGDRPVYKKWWLWTIVGVAVVGIGLGVGLGLGLQQPSAPQSDTDLGTVEPFE